MNIPEINTQCLCEIKFLVYEIYDDPLQYPDEWDWDNATVIRR